MQAHILEGMKMSSFDTLKFSQRALKAGFTQEQAEFQAEEMAKVIDENLVTKTDMESFQIEIEKLKASMEQQFHIVTLEMKAFENRMVLKLGSIMVVTISLLATIFKFF